MSTATQLRYRYLAHLSRPAADRALYKVVRRSAVQSILQFGLGDGLRAVRMLEVAAMRADASEIGFAAIDPFEDGVGGSTHWTLKQAHRTLKPLAGKVILAPGDPSCALPRVANSLRDVQLVVIGAKYEEAQLAGVWRYLPRMLHPECRVLREVVEGGKPRFAALSRLEIERLAASGHRRSHIARAA